jgi:molecular chaperone DnaK (HSP70)
MPSFDNMKIKSVHAVLCFVSLFCILSGCAKPVTIPRLAKSIGIITEGDVYTEIISKGESVPVAYSNSFGNADDGQQAVEITLAQKDQTGVEVICTVVVDELPPREMDGLHIIVTAKVDSDKNMIVKVTVSETGRVEEFGPFPVE